MNGAHSDLLIVLHPLHHDVGGGVMNDVACVQSEPLKDEALYTHIYRDEQRITAELRITGILSWFRG